MEPKVINRFPNYGVTPEGQVINLITGRVLRGSPNGCGRLMVTLSKGGYQKTITIHRLVADAFIPNPENKPTINHKDGNYLNNIVPNLEWATYSENNTHSYKVLGKQGTLKGRKDKDHPRYGFRKIKSVAIKCLETINH